MDNEYLRMRTHFAMNSTDGVNFHLFGAGGRTIRICCSPGLGGVMISAHSMSHLGGSRNSFGKLCRSALPTGITGKDAFSLRICMSRSVVSVFVGRG